MNLNQLSVALYTLVHKEVRRFMRIWPQTLLPPAITMSLYFVIFGNLVGSRIGEMGGFSYMQFIVPGLIMMAVITNSYANVSSSFFSAKFQKSIEELKEFEELIKPLLESLNIGKKIELKKVELVSKKEEKTLIKDTKQAYIYFGSSFNIDSKDEENYKAKVASFILGGSGFGSRLMEEIRVKRGLAYSAYGSISINKSHSYFNGYLQTKNESADEAKKLVKEIIQDFIEKGVTQEELTAAKNFLTGSEPLRSETLSQRLNIAFTLYYRGLEPDYSKKELEKIQSLELTDLNKYIKSHDEINNLTFSIVRK